jgi:two-component system response regulator (stage 0 sporulation protein F)
MDKQKILIVDDDEGVRDMLADFFGVLGYDPILACNGREALQLLEQNDVVLVLSDIKMPVMDGIEMLKRIKKRWGDLDVILITGYGPDYSWESVKKAGAADYVSKPFNIDVIERKVRSLIDKKVSEGVNAQ